jgi:hypothetical protein
LISGPARGADHQITNAAASRNNECIVGQAKSARAISFTVGRTITCAIDRKPRCYGTTIKEKKPLGANWLQFNFSNFCVESQRCDNDFQLRHGNIALIYL